MMFPHYDFSEMVRLIRIALFVVVLFGMFGSGCTFLEKQILDSMMPLEGYKKPKNSREAAEFLFWIYDKYVRIWEYESFKWPEIERGKKRTKLKIEFRRSWSGETERRLKKIIRTLKYGLKESQGSAPSLRGPFAIIEMREKTSGKSKSERYDLSGFFTEDEFRKNVFEKLPTYFLRVDCLDEHGVLLASSKRIPLCPQENAFNVSCYYSFEFVPNGLNFRPYGMRGFDRDIFPVEIDFPADFNLKQIETFRCVIVKESP